MGLAVALIEPQIPPNTGNIARLCAATDTALHVIEPLGFNLDDPSLKRAGCDYWQMMDAGAVEVVDFTDAGLASTYLLPPQEVEKVFLRLLSHLGSLNLDVIVVEVADGVLQPETAELLASPGFSYYCTGLVFAAGDAMGAVAGVQWLQRKGLEVSAISGALTASPLAVRETSSALGIPVIGKRELSDRASAEALLAQLD